MVLLEEIEAQRRLPCVNNRDVLRHRASLRSFKVAFEDTLLHKITYRNKGTYFFRFSSIRTFTCRNLANSNYEAQYI